MADRSIRPTSLPLGHSPWRSGAMTSRSAHRYRCSWRRSWRLQRFSSCATSAAEGMRHDNYDSNGGRYRRPSPPRPPWQHLARSAPHIVLVICLPDPVRNLLPDPAGLYVHHLSQNERRDLGCNKPLVGLPPHLVELYRIVDPEPVPDFLP